MAGNPIYRNKMVSVYTGATAGTSAKNGNTVDTKGWGGVVFLGRIGTAATDNLMNAAMATATGGTFTDMASTAIRNKTHMRLDIYRPRERYVRAEFARGTSSALGDAWAVLYEPAEGAVAATDNVGEFHLSPASGTK